MAGMTRLLCALLTVLSSVAAALENSNLQKYFEVKVRQISSNCLNGVESRDQWERLKPQYREQLFEMLGLSPLPPRGDLLAVVTGQVEREDLVVDKLHFQSAPGLYVTGNFYRPRTVTRPLPTILYLCGHGPVKTNGISYGNKVAYQHHGAWFARNGYACLIIDTIQLGEIEGVHHGTYREGMWWWNSYGYTPAGVEAWNAMRALDYLETRPEVDKSRFGVTGRSGGGAYSWWITALDDRVKVSAPVAGITDLQNHVVDGVVEGHCDCMFFVNTYRWDFPLLAALAAPRPLLLCNSDKDTIFPLDGVVRTHAKVKTIYDLYSAPGNLGLLITEGPHKDTQDLQQPVFRWFNRHLKGEDPLIEVAATRLFTPEELKVFDEIPEDELTSRIHEDFVTPALVKEPRELRKILLKESFGAWPTAHSNVYGFDEVQRKGKNRDVRTMEFEAEEGIRLSVSYSPVRKPDGILLEVISEEASALVPAFFREEGDKSFDFMRRAMSISPKTVVAFLTVRGDGSADPKKTIQIRRRYMLVGETLDGMRVRDIGRGIDLLRSVKPLAALPLHIVARGRNAANVAVYAAVGDKEVASLTLINFPSNELDQPDYLNFSRFTSMNEILRQLSMGGFGKPVKVSNLTDNN